MTTIDKLATPNTPDPVRPDTLPAAEGNRRLSIFAGWCRLLVCLSLLAAAQQCLRSLPSPPAPLSQLQPQWPGAQPAQMAAPRFMVDVNHASQHELEALPEVGPSLATRIVAHRRLQGAFRRIDDLMHVRGVGPRTLEQLRPMLLLGAPAESPPESPAQSTLKSR